ncbi:MAG: dTDP-4-dehydrorhamnose 3,5-epimerase [Flavobacteriales bacterium]
MKIIETNIKDLLIIEPKIFFDERGYFFESFNEDSFLKAGVQSKFVQDNISKSSKNTLRGLHFQIAPFAQGKLIKVLRGAVQDIAVDLRTASPTFGQYAEVVLSEENHRMLYIPPGFAHGFLTLEEDTIFSYKCTAPYNKDAERAILWNDPSLNIKWKTNNPIISQKDLLGRSFTEFKGLF